MSNSLGIPAASSTPELPKLEKEALLRGPAGTPPPSVQSNFENPPNLNTIIYITKTLCLTFTSLAVFTRVYTRRVLLRSMGYDDYMSVIAWLGLIGYVAASLLGTKAGAGVHIWDLQLEAFLRVLYWLDIVVVVYDPVNVVIKLAILLQYSRIFNPTGKKDLPMFVAIWFWIWSIVLFYLVEFFFNIFQCSPRERIWNNGVFNIISDFAILILPMLPIWRLQMSRRNKILMSGVFATGLLACVMSIMRTYSVWHWVENTDVSYSLAAFGLWSDAECAIGIIVGCLPVMPKFLQHIGPKISARWSKPTNILGYSPRSSTRTSKTDTLAKIKSPFAKYRAGLGTRESIDDPYSQLHGEYYTLNGFEASQLPANMPRTLTKSPVLDATMRDDLEVGHLGS